MSEPLLDQGFFSKVIDWLWAAVLALLAIVHKSNEARHKKTTDTIKTLSETMQGKIDHETRCVRAELKGKADAEDIRRMLEKIDAGRENIWKELAAVREDMHTKFDALKTLLMELRK